MKNLFISLVPRFTPFKSWIGELRNTNVLKADILAGITVALVLIPQSMAYAQLAWLPAYIWLYASFLPVIVAAFFGSSRQLATGPVAIVSLMTAAALEPLASSNPSWFVAYAALLALLVWIFQLALWLLKLWIIVNFLSHPVVVWFTNAWALIIASSQLNKIFWVASGKWEHHYEILYEVFKNTISWTHLLTLMIWLGSLSLLFIIKKISNKLPWVLIVVVAFTLISYYTKFKTLWGSVIGEIPSWLPSFSLPALDINIAFGLITKAMTIALVWFMEAISIAKWMASQSKQRISANQELVGQWLANIVSGFFSWYPVSGSFSRSAVNFSAGARTGFSSVVTWIIVALTLLFLTPLMYHLPQATLAAVIIMAVVNLIKIEPIIHAFKIQKHDGIVSIITFVATLYFAPNLEEWILLWVVLSLALFLYRSMKPTFVELALNKNWVLKDAKFFNLETSDNVWFYQFTGPLYFANAGYFEWKLLWFIASKPELKVIILDLEAVQEIDATGQEVIESIIDKIEKTGIEILFCRVEPKICAVFKNVWFFAHYDKSKIFHKRADAFTYIKEKYKKDVNLKTLINN